MSANRIVMSGVSRGLGLAMTAGFVEHGHTVLGCARSPELISELRARFGAPHCFDVVDVTDEQRVMSWATKILTEGDPPDLFLGDLTGPPAPLLHSGKV